MNSLLYYYNNVQKMAAYRQAKRMQRGALTAQGGFSTTDPALKQSPFTIQCVIRPTKVISTLQVAFNTKGDSTNPRVDLDKSGNIVIYGCRSILYNKPANLNSIYDIVFVATDSQLSLFVDGTLITSAPYANTISFYNIGFYFANNSLYFQGDYLLHRHFNYAMSADEVKALDNNNDPMGYVVPKAKRDGLLAEYLPQNLMGQKERPLQVISENSYTWDNVTTGAPSLDIRTNPGIKTGVTYKVNLTVSCFSEGEPYLYAGSRVSIPAANGTYDLLVTPSGDYSYISVYGGTNIQLKNLTITVNKVEVANVATSWLDSAKQLPLSDEYMEPLFESIGGYDMAANGAPEILYNE